MISNGPATERTYYRTGLMLRVTMRVYALVALKNGRGLRVNAGFSYTERWTTCHPQGFLPWLRKSSDFCITVTPGQ